MQRAMGRNRRWSWKGKERLSGVWNARLKAFVFLPGKKKKKKKNRRHGGGVLSRSMVWFKFMTDIP